MLSNVKTDKIYHVRSRDLPNYLPFHASRGDVDKLLDQVELKIASQDVLSSHTAALLKLALVLANTRLLSAR